MALYKYIKWCQKCSKLRDSFSFYSSFMKIPDTKVKDKHGTSYKTALCKFYSEDGKCKNEGNCHYAHGINELRMHLFYKTFLCKNAENCSYGKSCVYAHSEQELRTFALNLKHGAEVPPGNYLLLRNYVLLWFHEILSDFMNFFRLDGNTWYAITRIQNFFMSVRFFLSLVFSRFYKTFFFLLSRNFENGICFYGKTCVFAHGTQELRFSLANMNPEMLLSYVEEQNEKKEENSDAIIKTSRIVDPSISYASVLKNKF